VDASACFVHAGSPRVVSQRLPPCHRPTDTDNPPERGSVQSRYYDSKLTGEFQQAPGRGTSRTPVDGLLDDEFQYQMSE